jgi:hypothetical protein
MSLFLQTLVLGGILSVSRSLEEFHMKKILTPYGVCALAVALMVPLAQAQPAGMQVASEKMPEHFPTNSPGPRALCRASTTGSPAKAFAPSATKLVLNPNSDSG